jgi:hypothetical protein
VGLASGLKGFPDAESQFVYRLHEGSSVGWVLLANTLRKSLPQRRLTILDEFGCLGSGFRRDLRAAVIELERLMRAMAPEDAERLLDYARRLAR